MKASHMKAPSLATNCHGQRNPQCSGTGAPGAISVGIEHSTLHATGSFHGQTAQRTGPALDKGWGAWCDWGTPTPVMGKEVLVGPLFIPS